MKKILLLCSAGLLVIVFGLWSLAGAGSLNPPGAPSGTMKTLDEIEPRIAIPGSSTPAATYTISQPGSYYLTGDRVCAYGAISISADNVTLDLNGFSLVGPGIESTDPAAHGINIVHCKNLEIRNGTITNFRYAGINDFYGVDNGGRGYRIIGIRSLYNGLHGIRVDGRGHLVENCTVIGNGAHGIFMGSTEGSRVSGNVVFQNELHGIYVYLNCLVDHNVAYDNNQAGSTWQNIYTVTGNTYVENHAP